MMETPVHEDQCVGFEPVSADGGRSLAGIRLIKASFDLQTKKRRPFHAVPVMARERRP
jgi:hypothetical protein